MSIYTSVEYTYKFENILYELYFLLANMYLHIVAHNILEIFM